MPWIPTTSTPAPRPAQKWLAGVAPPVVLPPIVFTGTRAFAWGFVIKKTP